MDELLQEDPDSPRRGDRRPSVPERQGLSHFGPRQGQNNTINDYFVGIFYKVAFNITVFKFVYFKSFILLITKYILSLYI